MGLLVAWKLSLFRPGQFHVQWVMTRGEIVACTLQDVMVWAGIYVGVCLLSRGRETRWALAASLAAAHLTLLLVLIDVRCKQLLYQPLRWSTLMEAAADAAVAKRGPGGKWT
jgi:hypothetical protein